MLENGFQDYLFHHLSKDWGDADQPVAPRNLYLALLEDESDIF